MLSKFKIGHYTNEDAATGCTVILPPHGNTASAVIRGASPGSREYALLSPQRKISEIHALVLTGGSAFGLGCAHGVMTALAERQVGYQTSFGVVPIVPAAVIFDKNIGHAEAYPTEENARQALADATEEVSQSGNVGAGTGATVGKWAGLEFAVKGGLGSGSEQMDKIEVRALSVVNAVGDILDWDGSVLAGAADTKNRFLAQTDHRKRWQSPRVGLAENTVLCVVMTNARLTKLQANYVAQRAHYGIARRIEPSHTSYDGDTVFALASNHIEAPIDLIAGMAVKAVEKSIIDGVKSARSLGGYRCYRDLTGRG